MKAKLFGKFTSVLCIIGSIFVAGLEAKGYIPAGSAGYATAALTALAATSKGLAH